MFLRTIITVVFVFSIMFSMSAFSHESKIDEAKLKQYKKHIFDCSTRCQLQFVRCLDNANGILAISYCKILHLGCDMKCLDPLHEEALETMTDH